MQSRIPAKSRIRSSQNTVHMVEDRVGERRVTLSECAKLNSIVSYLKADLFGDVLDCQTWSAVYSGQRQHPVHFQPLNLT